MRIYVYIWVLFKQGKSIFVSQNLVWHDAVLWKIRTFSVVSLFTLEGPMVYSFLQSWRSCLGIIVVVHMVAHLVGVIAYENRGARPWKRDNRQSTAVEAMDLFSSALLWRWSQFCKFVYCFFAKTQTCKITWMYIRKAWGCSPVVM